MTRTLLYQYGDTLHNNYSDNRIKDNKMLFVLSGEIQIGKTRWLEALITELEAISIKSYGVVAPGVWRELPGASPGEPQREKLGIDNVLLPYGNRIPFARRADLARAEGTYNNESQSGKMKLAWAIDDNAIQCVNEHFAQIQKQGESPEAEPGLLIVDELGRLELKAGKGLTAAVELLESGPNALTPHAIIVVRKDLLPHIGERFELWEEQRIISPTPEAADEIKVLFAARA